MNQNLDELEPIPIADLEIEFPKLTVNSLTKQQIIKCFFYFFLISILPLFFLKKFPDKIKVLSLQKLQKNLFSNTLTNKFTFFIHNLDKFNDFMVTSFQVFTSDHQKHNLTMKIARSFVTNHWQNTQPQIFSKIITTNVSKPFQMFSDYINNIKTVRMIVEFEDNSTKILAINCFVEHSAKTAIYFEIFLKIGFVIVISVLFFSLTTAIDNNGLLYPSQFVTQFYLIPILICNFPIDIFRLFISAKLIRVVKTILDIISTETILAIEIWLIFLTTKRDSQIQTNISFLTFIVVGISSIINLFYGLYQTLSNEYNPDYYFPYIANYIAMSIIAMYSTWISKQTANDDLNISKIYLCFSCLMNIILIIIDIFSLLERHNINCNISMALKLSSRLAMALLLSYFHWPVDKNQFIPKSSKKDQIKRSDYTKYVTDPSKENPPSSR